MTTRIEQLPVLGHNGAETPNSMVFAVPVVSRTISGVQWQVCGYWARDSATNMTYADDRLVLGKRILPFGEWSWYICNGAGGLADIAITGDDSHDTVAVEIDADGYVHVWYDHHNDPLHYRRSDSALASWAGVLTTTLTMPYASAVTYPYPFRSPDGVLYYIGRHFGGTNNGDWYFFKYTEATTSWAACAGTGTDGLFLNGTADTRGPYPFVGPSFTEDWDGAGTGFLHFAWTLRRLTTISNNDVFHMRWNGTSWTQYDGTSQTMPATIATSRQILEVAESELLFNQSGMCVDANGRPHIALIKSDGTQHQLYDLYYNGSTWPLQQITSYATANTWSDYGRTCCACDFDTNEVFFWGTHNTLETGVQQWASDPGDFTAWTKTTFFSADVGQHEPCIDRQQWLADRVVCMWVHRGTAQADTLATPRLVTRLPKGRTSAWVEANWSRKHPIVVDETKVGTGGVTGYTVVLTRANFLDEVCDPSGANKAQKDGGDLRFFSDSALTTALACQVVSFGHDSTTGADDAAVEVRVGPLTLSDSTATTIYVAYAASSVKHQPFVDETGGALAAHDSSWSVMAPLNTATGNSAIVDDAGFGWTMQDVPTGAGQIGNEAEVTGDSGYILSSRTLGIGSAFSIAMVVDPSAAVSTAQTLFAADHNNSNRGMQFNAAATTGRPQLIRFSSASAVTTNITGTTDLRGSKKRLVAEWSTADGARVLVNGTQEASDANATAQHDDTALSWSLAHRTRSATPYGDQFMTGALDQFEVHTARRGSAWWTTDYNNVMSPATFAAAGAASDIGGAGNTVSPSAGRADVTGYAPILSLPRTVSPTAGRADVTGYAPALTQGAGQTIAPTAGRADVTGYAPTLALPRTVSPTAGGATATGYAPALLQPLTVAPAAGRATATGYAPTVLQPMTVAPGAGSVTATGYAPAISQLAAIRPPAGHVTATGYAPTLALPRAVAPGAGRADVAGYAPTVSQSMTLAPGAGRAEATGYAPTVTRLDGQTVAPAAGRADLSGHAPIIVQGATLSPTTGRLEITGYGPSITQASGPTVSPTAGRAEYHGYAPSLRRTWTRTLPLGSRRALPLRWS